MNILLDVDGVIADFVSQILWWHGRKDLNHDDVKHWDIHTLLGCTEEEFWKPTYEPGFWSQIKPYEWAHDLVDLCASMCGPEGKIVYATSPSLDAKCPMEKIGWLRGHEFMSLNHNDYMIGPHKHLMAGSGYILIDDSESNVSKFRQAGGKAILFPQPWNSPNSVIDRLEFVEYSLKAFKDLETGA